MILNSYSLPKEWHQYKYTVAGYRYRFSLRRAVFSVFDNQHNEFWMIWSDILPTISFTMIFLYHMYYISIKNKYIILSYIGIISSRFFSTIYHIFNCMSIEMNNRLFIIDMIGISNMVYVSCFLIRQLKNIMIIEIYTILLLSLHLGFVSCLTINIINQKNISNKEQYMLSSLILLGHVPNFLIVFNQDVDNIYKILSTIAFMSFMFGYLIYIYNYPECIYPLRFDKHFMHSHVIWHNMVSLSQICYIILLLNT